MIRFLLSFIILAIIVFYVSTYLYKPIERFMKSEKFRMRNRLGNGEDKNE